MGIVEKLKVMLTHKDGCIMSKCQGKTVEGDLVWTLAKNKANPEGLVATAEIFEQHGYNVVPWDDTVEVFKSKIEYKVDRDALNKPQNDFDKKNQRRCELVDKSIQGGINPEEKAELDSLQKEMLEYRNEVAPLPLEELRALHKELKEKK